MSKSKLLIVFKDSLAGTPEKLRYRVYINSVQIEEGEVTKHKDTASYQITWHENQLVIDKGRVTVPKQPYDYVEVKVVAGNGSEKVIGRHNHLKPTDTTLTLFSPWVRVPLAGGGKLEGDFFEVEYNIKIQKKNLFAKVVIKDIPRKIVLTALKYRGRKEWATDTEKISTRKIKVGDWTHDSPYAALYGGKPSGTKERIITQKYKYKNPSNKCSTFVYDVLHEVGIKVPWIFHGRIPEESPPLAAEWADPKTTALEKDWSSHKTPLPGDIGAYENRSDHASGHVGIILTQGVCISAASFEILVNDAGFRIWNGTGNAPNQIDFSNFRRYKHKTIK